MSHLIDALGYFLSWRVRACLVVAIVIAYALSTSGAVIIGGAILGLAIGFFWEAQVG
jgi:hypothetical protein